MKFICLRRGNVKDEKLPAPLTYSQRSCGLVVSAQIYYQEPMYLPFLEKYCMHGPRNKEIQTVPQQGPQKIKKVIIKRRDATMQEMDKNSYIQHRFQRQMLLRQQ